MSYDLTEFINKPPYDISAIPFDDNSGRAVFAARWFRDDFESLAEFLEFTYKYDSVMQPRIQGMADDKVQEWFVPSDDATNAAKLAYQKSQTRDTDAFHWVNRDLSFAKIPWLRDRDHTQIMEFSGDEFSTIVAVGPAGYLTMFVADLV